MADEIKGSILSSEKMAEGLAELTMGMGHFVISLFIEEMVKQEYNREQVFDEISKRMTISGYLFAHAQSPIEAILAAHLTFIKDGYGFLAPAYVFEEGDNSWRTVIEPQKQILGHAVDFCLTIYGGPKPAVLVVECDGHDFHERTKEQAKRDRSRDRELTLAGYKVLRYTGSEIYQDTAKCAEEIEGALYDLNASIVEYLQNQKNADSSTE